MRWSGATDATARGKSRSTGCALKRRSVRLLPWICGVKPKPKVVNKPSPHSIMHGLDKPGVFTTVSFLMCIQQYETSCQSQNHQYRDDACTLINVYEYASAKKEDKHPDEHQADGVVP